MVIAAAWLYKAILVYERVQRNILHSESRGNICYPAGQFSMIVTEDEQM